MKESNNARYDNFGQMFVGTIILSFMAAAIMHSVWVSVISGSGTMFLIMRLLHAKDFVEGTGMKFYSLIIGASVCSVLLSSVIVQEAYPVIKGLETEMYFSLFYVLYLGGIEILIRLYRMRRARSIS